MTDKKRVNKRRRRNQTKSRPSGIPPFVPDQVFGGSFRYCVAPAGADTVSFTLELPIAPYGVSSSSTNVILPFKAVRLSRVQIWCNYRPEKDLTGNTISLTAVQRRGVRPIEWTDSATFQKPAYISKSFNKLEPLGLYYTTGSGESNPELTFQITKGSVIQLDYAWVMSDGENAGSFTGSSLAYPVVYTNRLHADIDPIGKVYHYVITM